MKYTAAPLPGVWIIDVERHGDRRGYFAETFRADEFERHVGPVHFVQENESLSCRGVVRGLHYQCGGSAQAKLVRIARGAIMDVIVDLRRESPTFGRHMSVLLDAREGRQLFVPRGFAHGFAVLSDEALFLYKVDNYYDPSAERGICPFDPTLAIEWPVDRSAALLSPKDLAAQNWPPADLF